MITNLDLLNKILEINVYQLISTIQSIYLILLKKCNLQVTNIIFCKINLILDLTLFEGERLGKKINTAIYMRDLVLEKLHDSDIYNIHH